jgi:hypothetical protein
MEFGSDENFLIFSLHKKKKLRYIGTMVKRTNNMKILEEISRYAYSEAKRLGLLSSPNVCSVCSLSNESGRAIEGHHKNYHRPFDVIWLCKKCHAEEHKKQDYHFEAYRPLNPLSSYGNKKCTGRGRKNIVNFVEYLYSTGKRYILFTIKRRL